MGTCVNDVSIGSDNSVWVIGCEPVDENGNAIYKLNKGQNKWERVDGTALKIKVLNEVAAVVVTALNEALKTYFPKAQ